MLLKQKSGRTSMKVATIFLVFIKHSVVGLFAIAKKLRCGGCNRARRLIFWNYVKRSTSSGILRHKEDVAVRHVEFSTGLWTDRILPKVDRHDGTPHLVELSSRN